VTHKSGRHHVVIVGGGFGGLYAARRLGKVDVDVTLVDRRNHHIFQPLLYQVATGGLSPGDISSPLRAILKKQKNIRTWQAEVDDIDAAGRRVILRDGELHYDTLVLATGVHHAYFGHDDWADFSSGLKTIEDALRMRRRIFLAFEAAEREPDPERRRRWMTFVIVGGGPTGVELAGALGELARQTLRRDFRAIDPSDAKVILVEGKERLLPTYPPELSASAEAALERLGVTIRTDTMVTGVEDGTITVEHEGRTERIGTRTNLWAAGVQASPLGPALGRATGAELDRAGRVLVEPDLTVRDHPEIFVIGDLANFTHQGEEPLPGVAPVAMQEGRFVAQAIERRIRGRDPGRFRYKNKGNLAVIGRNAAVADFGATRFSGFPAWLAWVFIHIWYLIEFDSKIMVMMQWAVNYFTRKRGARLITGSDPQPLVETQAERR
jgi:NADH dehydrogenase